ncbi:universal stress protein [Tenacibaculum aestuariivivum]|uniref:universal stress protein n=1 Tax=Tenacibaculum aestuariivivum TaxID=2006131 RepID=UPI003AB17F3A
MIKNILIGIAFSPNLKANLFEAIRLSNMFNAQLIGVHVGKKSEEKEKQLQQLLTKTPKLKHPLKVIWQEGKPVDVILQIVILQNVDLLILGALQKEKIYKYYVGSIARKLTRKAPCSVLLLIKPSTERVNCKHIVISGLQNEKTEATIKAGFNFSKILGCKRVTIVEEVGQTELNVKVNDDVSLRKSTLIKQRMQKREDARVNKMLQNINTNDIIIKTQSIFGRRGYSIGHYAKVKRADLLVISAPKKTKILDRIFPHDIEYILSELPTDVLIVK